MARWVLPTRTCAMQDETFVLSCSLSSMEVLELYVISVIFLVALRLSFSFSVVREMGGVIGLDLAEEGITEGGEPGRRRGEREKRRRGDDMRARRRYDSRGGERSERGCGRRGVLCPIAHWQESGSISTSFPSTPSYPSSPDANQEPSPRCASLVAMGVSTDYGGS